MLRSVRTYATSAAIWGKESSPYKVQAQHAIPNIMNPPSFPQFYILHLHFLSNRKKGNENIEDKSKPDTWRSSEFSEAEVWVSEFLLNDTQAQSSKIPSEASPDPFLEPLSSLQVMHSGEGRLHPDYDIGIGFWKGEVGERDRVHLRENFEADSFPDPSVSLFFATPSLGAPSAPPSHAVPHLCKDPHFSLPIYLLSSKRAMFLNYFISFWEQPYLLVLETQGSLCQSAKVFHLW